MGKPFKVVERGDCYYCDGKGKPQTWDSKKMQYVSEDRDCFYCEGAGKVDKEVDLIDALRDLGVVIRGESL